MAYDKEKKEIIFPIVKTKEPYREKNARKSNSKKRPNGYLYVLICRQFDLIKIGASSKPKRRIRDINAYLPFETETIFLEYFLDVYQLEEIIHVAFENNRVKGEWFQVYPEDVKGLCETLNDIKKWEKNLN